MAGHVVQQLDLLLDSSLPLLALVNAPHHKLGSFAINEAGGQEVKAKTDGYLASSLINYSWPLPQLRKS